MIDEKRWHKYNFYQQMGNIASEISRAENFEKKKDEKHKNASLLRLIELVDLTIEDKKNRLRLKELCRFKEVIGDWFCQTNVYHINPASLKNYAMQFVLLLGKK